MTTSTTPQPAKPLSRHAAIRVAVVIVLAATALAVPPAARPVAADAPAGCWATPETSSGTGSGVWLAGCSPETTFRLGHSTTLLNDGRVLVAGGVDSDGNALKSAEIFDPVAGTWTPADDLEQARGGHSATVLKSGKVLIAGGYDPATQQTGVENPLPPTGDPIVDRGIDIILAGRCVFDAASLPFPCDDALLTSSEVFDPSAGGPGGAWSSAGSLPSPRFAHTAVLLPSGNVLIAGGLTTFYSDDPSSAVYRASDGIWHPSGPLAPRSGHTANLLEGEACASGIATVCGTVLVAGGLDRVQSFGLAPEGDQEAPPELYEPTSGSFVPIPQNMHVPRIGHTSTTLDDGKILLAGGRTVAGPASPAAEIFDPSFTPPKNPWSLTGRLRDPRFGHQAARLTDGGVLVTGGTGAESDLASVEIYRPGEGAWAPAASMAVAREADSFTATSLTPPGCHGGSPPVPVGYPCGNVVVVGGSTEVPVEMYVPAPTISNIAPRSGHAEGGTAVVLEGTALAHIEKVSFGGAQVQCPSAECSPAAPDRVVVTAPPMGNSVKVDVTVTTLGGTATVRNGFTYTGAPGGISDLSAVATSAREARLTFSAPGLVGAATPPATRYLVRQSASPILGDAGWDAAQEICPSAACTFGPDAVGSRVEVNIDQLEPDEDYFWAVRAVGPAGELAPLSNVAQVSMPRVPPGGITDLTATAVSPSEVRLTFSAPPGNGFDPPPATHYVIKQALAPIISDAAFAEALSLCSPTCRFNVTRVGEPISVTVSGLTPGKTYYYAVQPQDEARNAGPLSNPAVATTPKGAPGSIDDLRGKAVSGRKVELAWTAPVVDGRPLRRYDVRQVKGKFTTWDAAHSLCDPVCIFPPDVMGTASAAVGGLAPGTRYHYAVRPISSDGELGPLSNVAAVRTPGGRPGRIKNLRAKVTSPTSIKLVFSAPSTAGPGSPPATRYDVRQARRPITKRTFRRARALCPKVCRFSPGRAGERITAEVTDLAPGRTYYYAVQAIGKQGRSRPSRLVKVTLPSV